MNKLEVFNNLKNRLENIKQLMQQLKDDLVPVLDCISEEKFISTDIGHKIIDVLTQIDVNNQKCEEIYNTLSDNPADMTSIKEFETKLIDIEKVINAESKSSLAALFFKLHSNNTEIDFALTQKKSILKNFFDNNCTDENLDPFIDFVNAINVANNPTPDFPLITSYIAKLESFFGADLLAHACFHKDIYLDDNDDVIMVEDRANAENSIMTESETEVEDCIIDESELSACNDSTENIFFQKLQEYDAFIPEDYDFGELVIENHPSKSITAKTFKNTMHAHKSNLASAIIRASANSNVITEKSILNIINCNLSEAEAELSYLVKKGYLIKYTIEEHGHFYCLSENSEKALTQKSVREFLKLPPLKGKNTAEERIENSSLAAFTRITYSTLSTTCGAYRNLKSFSTSELIHTNIFNYSYFGNDKDDDIDMIFGFLGDANEKYNEFYDNTVKTLEQYPYLKRVIYAGLNKEHAIAFSHALKDSILSEISIENEYLYDAVQKKFYSVDAKEELTADNIWNSNDTESETSLISPTESTQTPEITEEPEIYDHDTIEPDVAESKGCSITELKDFPIIESTDNSIADLSNDLNQIYSFINSGKSYCATAYMKAARYNNAEWNSIYNQLAYALNDPAQRCVYSSDKVFNMMSETENAMSDYLLISVMLRTFFYNDISFDYQMKQLYESLEKSPTLSSYPVISKLIYSIMSFKIDNNKGIDVYADYHVIADTILENRKVEVMRKAKDFYATNFDSPIIEKTHHTRFYETKKAIFSKNTEAAIILEAIAEGDTSLNDSIKAYICKHFIKNDFEISIESIDEKKIGEFVDDAWYEAKDKVREQKASSDLMGSLRNNLCNLVKKFVVIMCEWIILSENFSNSEDFGKENYIKIKETLIADINVAISTLKHQLSEVDSDAVKAGINILSTTLKELRARLAGEYNDIQKKYFYIDFLRTADVLLTDEYLVDFHEYNMDITEMSLKNRIINHANATLHTFEDRLEQIFKGEDDYGSAQLIDTYLQDTKGISLISETSYNLSDSITFAKRSSDRNLEQFIGDLELAQAYGQITSTSDIKEKVLSIAKECKDYTEKTNNYGFLRKITDNFRQYIKNETPQLADSLKEQYELAAKAYSSDNTADFQHKLDKIKEMLNIGNYTAAEDYLSRLNDPDDDSNLEFMSKDHLAAFINNYDKYYRKVANSGESLKKLVASVHNKNTRGALRLAENWMQNGTKPSEQQLKTFLGALGFSVDKVALQKKIDKMDNFRISLLNSGDETKRNFPHPIAAFGSHALENGFLVVCLYGNHTADGLIDKIKNISNENTIILLDYTISLPERRKLARKIKTDIASDKIYGIIDRTLLTYLMDNYDEVIINKILMSIMLPYAYYQPYIPDSSQVLPPELFIGRKDELNKIESPTGVNIVYGGRQLGKSALLQMAKNNIDRNSNNDRAILVDIKGKNHIDAAKKVGDALFDEGILDQELDNWEEIARAIKNRLNSKTLPKIPYFLLLLDEADVFIESCAAIEYQPFDLLKDIQQIGANRFKFVVAGLHNIVRFKKEAALSNNSVLTHLSSLTVKPFQVLEARELLELPLYYLGLRFNQEQESLITMILASTNYFPGLIQLYCKKLIEAMRKDYADYEEKDTPPYYVSEKHIKKVLADKEFRDQIYDKFKITLQLGEDNYYLIIALVIAYLYYEKGYTEGYDATDIYEVGTYYNVKKITDLSIANLSALLEELCELNILRTTLDGKYLFSRHSFFEMMGTFENIEDGICEFMEE